MRSLYGLAASGFAILSIYAVVQQNEARTALSTRSPESYTAAVAALDNADAALAYTPEQDREINVFGESVPFGIQEVLPDLDRARKSLDDAITAAPAREKPALQQLAEQLREPGLHQTEKNTIGHLRQDYIHKQSEADSVTYRLQQAQHNNGTAGLFFACAAGLFGTLFMRSRKK